LEQQYNGGERRFDRPITQKGQVTVPAEIRRALGLRPGDSILFMVSGGHVTIERAPSIRDFAGFLKRPGQKSLSDKELREIREQAWVAEERGSYGD
jgi:AbrB family looped-hinge helix DNA binding protein